MNSLAIDGGTPVSDHLIGYGHQYIDDDDINAVVDTLKSDYLTCGPKTKLFEKTLSQKTGAKYVTAVANGTAALHIACLAAGITKGDEVIVSSITFAASANCVLYCGAKPIFADIDPDSWNISPSSVEKLITSKTKAIIAVDFGGVPVDATEIRRICNENNLLFIEDAAHSLGSYYNNTPIGSVADITTFSFHPVKTITTGEGGAIATNDKTLAKQIELFSKHGITRDRSLMQNTSEGDWYYEQILLGYNYRISDLQAALGISQISKLNHFISKRQQIVDIYNQAFKKVPCVSFQYDSNPKKTARHLYCLRFDLNALDTSKKFLYDAFLAEGIGVNVHYLPVYRLPFYRDLGYSFDICPEANKYYEESLTLPLHYCLTENEVASVIEATEKIVKYCLSK